jgi:hypothetical protein
VDPKLFGLVPIRPDQTQYCILDDLFSSPKDYGFSKHIFSREFLIAKYFVLFC